MAKEKEERESCGCGEDCDCGQECDCNMHNKCSDKCTCDHHDDKNCHDHDKKQHKHCHCDDKKEAESSAECDCGQECNCSEKECGCYQNEDKSEEYLNLARQIQADFENFRRRTADDLKQARFAGQASVIEAFLPCLDTFKEAKKSIKDEDVLKGVEMIENKINEALEAIGVQKINSIGEKYNPHIHNVIAVLNVADKDDDIILDEYQAGYVLNGKVIRYAKVIVNKKEG